MVKNEIRTLEELQSEYEFLLHLPNGIQIFHHSLTDYERRVIKCRQNPTFNNVITLINADFEMLKDIIATNLVVFENATRILTTLTNDIKMPH